MLMVERKHFLSCQGRNSFTFLAYTTIVRWWLYIMGTGSDEVSDKLARGQAWQYAKRRAARREVAQWERRLSRGCEGVCTRWGLRGQWKDDIAAVHIAL